MLPGPGDDGKALELLEKAAEVERNSGAAHNYQVSLANIGNVYLHRSDHFRAISYHHRALALARQIKDPVSIKKWTYNINLAYGRIRAAVDQNRSSTARAAVSWLATSRYLGPTTAAAFPSAVDVAVRD